MASSLATSINLLALEASNISLLLSKRSCLLRLLEMLSICLISWVNSTCWLGSTLNKRRGTFGERTTPGEGVAELTANWPLELPLCAFSWVVPWALDRQKGTYLAGWTLVFLTVVGKEKKMVLVWWEKRRTTLTLFLAAVLEDLVLDFRMVLLSQLPEMILESLILFHVCWSSYILLSKRDQRNIDCRLTFRNPYACLPFPKNACLCHFEIHSFSYFFLLFKLVLRCSRKTMIFFIIFLPCLKNHSSSSSGKNSSWLPPTLRWSSRRKPSSWTTTNDNCWPTSWKYNPLHPESYLHQGILRHQGPHLPEDGTAPRTRVSPSPPDRLQEGG